jgi:hypothetical protein
VKLARHISALTLATLAILVAGGPLGCELLGLSVPEPPKVPEAPQMPEAPELPEAPQPPDPPEKPQAPTVDVPPDHDGGVCCMRSGAVERVCGSGAKRCCTLKYDDTDVCEESGGLWFSSVAGCRGAC